MRTLVWTLRTLDGCSVHSFDVSGPLVCGPARQGFR